MEIVIGTPERFSGSHALRDQVDHLRVPMTISMRGFLR